MTLEPRNAPPEAQEPAHQAAQEIGLEEDPVVNDEDTLGRGEIEERLRSTAVSPRCLGFDEPDGVAARLEDAGETRKPGSSVSSTRGGRAAITRNDG